MKKNVVLLIGLMLLVSCASKEDMTFYGINENQTTVIAVIAEAPSQYRMISLRIDSRDLGDYRNLRLTQHGRQLNTADGELTFSKSGDDMTELRRGLKYSRKYTPLSADEMRERLTKLLDNYTKNAETLLLYDYSIQIELVNKILNILDNK